MNFDVRSHANAVAPIMSRLPPPSLARHDSPRPDTAERKRTRIWDLHSNLHCSIIGTCLSASELRQILGRVGISRPEVTDHELHIEGVRIAGRHDATGKILNKALDQRHRLSIKRATGAQTADQLLAYWKDGVQQGEIPGTYWAVLTHPMATEALIRRAFGDVHMLSHLVGSANRADLKRLCQLEAEKVALEERLQRQQIQLRDGILARDETIRELRLALVSRVVATPHPGDDTEDDARRALEKCVADLERRLSVETRRREAIEQRHQQARQELSVEAAARRAAERSATQLTDELQAVEAALMPDLNTAISMPNLDDRLVLYVGGRPNLVPSLRVVTEQLGARFLHHDGGIEESSNVLAGLIARADIVVFPVDCISHDAALSVKRLCRQQGKAFVPLRSSGTSSLLVAPGKEAPLCRVENAPSAR